MQLKRHTTKILLIALAGILVLSADMCSSDNKGAGQKTDSGTQQSNYDRLVAQEPAHTMPYSPTRQTINAWIDTWGVKGQLAFTYILNQNGDKIGYYVFEGPPVSQCVGLTPSYKLIDPGGSSDNGDIPVAAPSIDGAYYSGGQCADYYGKDAATGQLIEFSTGTSLNFITSTQPLYLNVAPLGKTTIADVHKDASGKYIAP